MTIVIKAVWLCTCSRRTAETKRPAAPFADESGLGVARDSLLCRLEPGYNSSAVLLRRAGVRFSHVSPRPGTGSSASATLGNANSLQHTWKVDTRGGPNSPPYAALQEALTQAQAGEPLTLLALNKQHWLCSSRRGASDSREALLTSGAQTVNRVSVTWAA